MGVIHTGKYYTFLFLIYVFCILSCTTAQGGATIKEQPIEPQSAVLKNEGTPLPPTAGAGVSMRVLWTVSQYIIGERANWNEKEARQLLFQPLESCGGKGFGLKDSVADAAEKENASSKINATIVELIFINLVIISAAYFVSLSFVAASINYLLS